MKNKFIRHINKKNYYWINFTILIAAVTIIFDIFCTIVTLKNFPQLTLTSEDLIGIDAENLKDFKLNETGNLISESSDPWIWYPLQKQMNIKTVKIIVDSVSKQNLWAELHFIPEDSDWFNQSFYIHNGENSIQINDKKGVENISVIRFDLVNNIDISVKLDRIIINNPFTLSIKYHLMSIIVIIAELIVIFIIKRGIKIQKDTFHKVSSGLYISIAISFMLNFFAPLDLYFNNWDEFWFDVYDLFPLLLIMFILGSLIGSVITLILYLFHEKLYYIELVMGIALYISAYIQGNYLIKNLPPLDGSEFNWKEFESERIYSILLWCITLIISITIYKTYRKKFHYIVKYVSGGLTTILIITLCIECILTYGYQDKLNADITTNKQFEMSKNENFIILVLDALDAEEFTKIIDNNPKYKNIFSDFTYYPNTMGAYSYTSRSIPFILSGKWFENKELFSKYNENVYKDNYFFTMLEENGFKLHIYETGVPLTDNSIFRFENILKYDTKIKNYLEFGKLELKLAGLKYAPFDLKKYCVTYTGDFNILRTTEDKAHYPIFYVNNQDFYKNILDEAITFSTEKIFKFIHIEGAHVPFRYDKDVNIIENGTYEQNIEASLTIADTYINKLKNSNVYDNSVIIIMADHGFLNNRQNPMLMIKGRFDTHDTMKIINAPISYDDLQSAYLHLLDGKSADDVFEWKEGEKRERRYLWYEYINDKKMIEYIQTGIASDVSTLIPTGKEFNQ